MAELFGQWHSWLLHQCGPCSKSHNSRAHPRDANCGSWAFVNVSPISGQARIWVHHSPKQHCDLVAEEWLGDICSDIKYNIWPKSLWISGIGLDSGA